MPTYAIGDIQGCFETLQKLLRRIDFNPDRDRVWLAGDLVNRGPRSLEVLRWAKALGDRVVAVLGNHDLHLLSRSQQISEPKKRDTLEPVLAAPDADELMTWLRAQPLLYREGDYVLFHGGLAPEWSLMKAESLAREAEQALRGPNYLDVLQAIESGKPQRWNPKTKGLDKIQNIFHIFTRLRLCRPDESFNFEFKGAPDQAPKGEFPWYEAKRRKRDDATLLFGHWAALGLQLKDRWIALDSGCVWQNQLSAVRLEDRQVFQEPYSDG